MMVLNIVRGDKYFNTMTQNRAKGTINPQPLPSNRGSSPWMNQNGDSLSLSSEQIRVIDAIRLLAGKDKTSVAVVPLDNVSSLKPQRGTSLFVTGRPGTGKSWLADLLSSRLGIPHVRSDHFGKREGTRWVIDWAKVYQAVRTIGKSTVLEGTGDNMREISKVTFTGRKQDIEILSLMLDTVVIPLPTLDLVHKIALMRKSALSPNPDFPQSWKEFWAKPATWKERDYLDNMLRYYHSISKLYVLKGRNVIIIPFSQDGDIKLAWHNEVTKTETDQVIKRPK